MNGPAGAVTGGDGDRRWVLGVDSGGSGLRAALGAVAPDGRAETRAETRSRVPVRTGAGGIEAAHLLEQLLPAARRLLAEAAAGNGPPPPVTAVCVGAAGMATLGADLRAALPGALARELGVERLALAADAATGYAGALGERPGAVVAAGTGLIAVGTDLRGWRRVDGWGHLLGDCGSGAWIGRAGLEAVMRAHDGRRGGSPALLARAEERFGPAGELPGALYPRTDRPAVMASFAPDVARCAADGDAVAAEILRRAGGHIAETAAAACPPDGDGTIALTGGLLGIGEPLLAPVREELRSLLPGARLVPAAGTPLDGSLLVAARLATGTLRLPAHPSLLTLH